MENSANGVMRLERVGPALTWWIATSRYLIKVLHTDGGGEDMLLKFETYLTNCGIIHGKML